MLEKVFVTIIVSLIVGFIATLEGKRNKNRIEKNAKRNGISISQAMDEEEQRAKRTQKNIQKFAIFGILGVMIFALIIAVIYGR